MMMRYTNYVRAVISICLLAGIFSCSNNDTPEVVRFRVIPFDISDVRLLEGSFLHATELNESILLNYEPDRFLARFRMEAGLEPKAEHYHGWELSLIHI